MLMIQVFGGVTPFRLIFWMESRVVLILLPNITNLELCGNTRRNADMDNVWLFSVKYQTSLASKSQTQIYS